MVSVRQAIERMSLDDFADALAPDVVWVGLHPRELCRSRDDVLDMFARMREREVRLRPSIVAERDDILVVDPHLDRDGRHHVLVLDEGRVSEVRVYPDRRTALEALEAVAS